MSRAERAFWAWAFVLALYFLTGLLLDGVAPHPSRLSAPHTGAEFGLGSLPGSAGPVTTSPALWRA